MIPTAAMTTQSPYYSMTDFALMSPMAAIFSTLAQLTVQLVRPFPSLRLKIHDLPPPIPSKKVALVTGSNSGIGYETAKALAERGYEVILACRSRDKALQAVQSIRDNAVFCHPLDLSSFQSIKEFSTVIQNKYEHIDVLINNAGTNNAGGMSTDGFDMCFQSNFLGHFLLTHQLLPLLNKGARIVNLSSVMHHFCSSNLDAEYWKRQCHAGSESYNASKLAAILFTRELNNRYYKSKGIRSIAVNPGAV